MATFQITSVKTRYFEFEAPDTGEILHLEPPKLETVNEFEKLDRTSTPADLAAVIAKMISKNKEQRDVTTNDVMAWMDSDQAGAFIGAFMGWMNGVRQSDPN